MYEKSGEVRLNSIVLSLEFSTGSDLKEVGFLRGNVRTRSSSAVLLGKKKWRP